MATLQELTALIVAEDVEWSEYNHADGDGPPYHWVIVYGRHDGSGKGHGEPGDPMGNGYGNDWTLAMMHEQYGSTIELLCMLIRAEEEECEEWEYPTND